MLIPHLFRIREDQDDRLKELPGSISDHVRRAIDDYLLKNKPESTTSESRRGEIHG